MKIAATALLLASALAGTAAQINDFTPIITGAQTVKENICKDTVKSLLVCAVQKEYVSAGDTWATNNVCLPDVQTTFSKCKGSTLEYSTSESDPAVPAYAAAATLTRGLQLQGLVAIPSQDSKLRGVSCAICSKFTKKLLECALPVTPADADLNAAFTAATQACLTTPWDRVLSEMCMGDISPLAVDAENRISYVFMSPRLTIAALSEGCSSIEAKAKPNGAVFARVGKGSIEQDIE